MKQCLERGQQRHEQRGALALAESLYRIPERLRECRPVPAPAESLHGGARAIGGEFQEVRRARELAFPVGELLLQNFALHPLPLPHGEVRVLNRQLRQVRRAALDERLIKRGQFAKKHSHRPAICRDVVERQNQHVIGPAQPPQGHPQHEIVG